MNKVVLTKTLSGFCNVAPNYAIGDYDDGGSARVSVRTYILPDGYRVHTSDYGVKYIYDSAGRACDIFEHVSGYPQLISGGNRGPVLAAQAWDGEKYAGVGEIAALPED